MPDSGKPPPEQPSTKKPTLADQHWRALLRHRAKAEVEQDMLEAVDKGDMWRFSMLLDLKTDWASHDQVLRRMIEKDRADMFAAVAAKDTGWRDGSSINSLASFAAETGRLDFVKLFVEQYKADIHNYSDEMLRNAAHNGHEEVVGYLLSKGADHSAWSGDPLKNAAEQGHLGVVKKLVEAGAEINTSNSYSYGGYGDVLDRAARGGHIKVVEYLLDKGADPKAGSYEAFLTACRNNHAPLVDLFLKHGVEADARDGEGFIGACENKAFAAAKALLAAGADPNAQQGRALRLAAWRNEAETVKFLLENGADPNAHTHSESPLTEAVRAGNKDIVVLLLKHGADQSVMNHEAWHTARRNHSRDMQHALIDGARAAREKLKADKFAEFRMTFASGYTFDDLREKKGPSGDTGLLIAAHSGRFADLLRGAKGGSLLPSDLFHPDDRLDSVMSVLYRNKTLQQFFDPAFWAERSGQVVDAYESLPAALQKRVKLDGITAQINQGIIMKKAMGGGGSNGLKPKIPKLPKPPAH